MLLILLVLLSLNPEKANRQKLLFVMLSSQNIRTAICLRNYQLDFSSQNLNRQLSICKKVFDILKVSLISWIGTLKALMSQKVQLVTLFFILKLYFLSANLPVEVLCWKIFFTISWVVLLAWERWWMEFQQNYHWFFPLFYILFVQNYRM